MRKAILFLMTSLLIPLICSAQRYSDQVIEIKGIPEFGIPWLGFTYQPHPDSITTINTLNNERVRNNDSRGVAIFAFFTGMLWKKGI